MIYNNNYGFAGKTAIIYNLELDYSALGHSFSYGDNSFSTASNTGITEVGIEYKKHSDSVWNSIKVTDDSALEDGRVVFSSYLKGVWADGYVLDYGTYLTYMPYNYFGCHVLYPMRIVIKGLDANTSYDVRSYYVKNGSKSTFNSWTNHKTLPESDITYECTSVSGGTSEQNSILLETVNKACDIYNSMTSFNKSDYSDRSDDYLHSKLGGQFTATVGDPGGDAAAHSAMVFAPSAIRRIDTAIHEMAHNVMFSNLDTSIHYIDSVDINASNRAAFDADVMKFMEFATHCEGAMWGWIGSHNYPVISSAAYNEVENYLVAAACQVCRTAGS